jgi:hypothetical protein
MNALDLELEPEFAKDEILVPATLPPVPLVIANEPFLKQLHFYEERIKVMAVESPEAAQQAAEILTSMTKAGTLLNKTRLALNRPFLDIGKAINATAAEVDARIETVKTIVKKHLNAWTELENARLRKEEEARQAELAKLEAQRLKEEAEAAAKAAELAAKAAPPIDEIEFDEAPEVAEPEKTETEKAIERVKFAPAPVASQPSGIRHRSRLLFNVYDVAKLPEQYILRTPNERLIRDAYVTGWKDGDPIPMLPGVSFKVDKTVESTGRGAF